MHLMPVYIKRIAAVLLLSLFAFILTEKSIHGHAGVTKKVVKGCYTITHSAFSCLICDFQLTADADMPSVLEEQPGIFLETIYLDGLRFTCFNHSLFYFAERGPPAYQPALL